LLPLCLASAFLLLGTQINSATNKKITTQNYFPPCQQGKLPSSRISTDILAPVPKTSSNSVPQLIKSHHQKLSPPSKCHSPPKIPLPSNPPTHVNLLPPLFLLHRLLITPLPAPVLRPSFSLNVFIFSGFLDHPSLHTQPFYNIFHWSFKFISQVIKCDL